MERIILHCDMNNFYASVECRRNPTLRGLPIAVCGSEEERHGIVLAKSEAAKAFGICTGDTVYSARQKCPTLVIVPPHFDEYVAASRQARAIYARFTDQVEPFGLDECWLDVTGSTGLFGDGPTIADTLRQTIRQELGLTISVGVSFNKIFAKLGSDLKKPDAVTCIFPDTFRAQLWELPVGALLGVGGATRTILEKCGIRTIGQLAAADPAWLKYHLKGRAAQLVAYANGQDTSPVRRMDVTVPAKSVGHGVTAPHDLTDSGEIWPVMLELTQDIGHKLRVCGRAATGVAIAVRDNSLRTRQWQRALDTPTQSPLLLARAAFALFEKVYPWRLPVRAVTVTAIGLADAGVPCQLKLLEDPARLIRQEKLDDTVERLRARFGADAVRNAVLCGGAWVPQSGGICSLPTGVPDGDPF